MIIKNGILIEVENKDIPESGIIVIPDNVKAIAQYAFYNATKMEEVIFRNMYALSGKVPFGNVKTYEEYNSPMRFWQSEEQHLTAVQKLKRSYFQAS